MSRVTLSPTKKLGLRPVPSVFLSTTMVPLTVPPSPWSNRYEAEEIVSELPSMSLPNAHKAAGLKWLVERGQQVRPARVAVCVLGDEHRVGFVDPFGDELSGQVVLHIGRLAAAHWADSRAVRIVVVVGRAAAEVEEARLPDGAAARAILEPPGMCKTKVVAQLVQKGRVNVVGVEVESKAGGAYPAAARPEVVPAGGHREHTKVEVCSVVAPQSLG
eukprot:scaffold3553_cov137-Isochrysis_galbana.AAC.1